MPSPSGCLRAIRMESLNFSDDDSFLFFKGGGLVGGFIGVTGNWNERMNMYQLCI